MVKDGPDRVNRAMKRVSGVHRRETDQPFLEKAVLPLSLLQARVIRLAPCCNRWRR